MRRDDEALVFALGARETEALKSVCAPGAVSCPVTIARGSTQAPHDPTLTPYPAFVAGVLAERMGKETASLARLETRSGWDHFEPVADPGGFAERVWNHVADVARDSNSRAEESRSRTERTRGENGEKENETIATNETGCHDTTRDPGCNHVAASCFFGTHRDEKKVCS